MTREWNRWLTWTKISMIKDTPQPEAEMIINSPSVFLFTILKHFLRMCIPFGKFVVCFCRKYNYCDTRCLTFLYTVNVGDLKFKIRNKVRSLMELKYQMEIWTGNGGWDLMWDCGAGLAAFLIINNQIWCFYLTRILINWKDLENLLFFPGKGLY